VRLRESEYAQLMGAAYGAFEQGEV
jgi:hypothetical protein